MSAPSIKEVCAYLLEELEFAGQEEGPRWDLEIDMRRAIQEVERGTFRTGNRQRKAYRDVALRIDAEAVDELLKRPGRHSIGGNLILVVGDNGNASWLARLPRLNGGRSDVGLGPAPEVPIHIAHRQAQHLRKKALEGADLRVEMKLLRSGGVPFETVARRLHEEKKSLWSNDKHAAQWLSTLQTYVFPHIGSIPIHCVTVSECVEPLRDIYARAPETARRTAQRIGAIFEYAADKRLVPIEINSAAILRRLGVHHAA